MTTLYHLIRQVLPTSHLHKHLTVYLFDPNNVYAGTENLKPIERYFFCKIAAHNETVVQHEVEVLKEHYDNRKVLKESVEEPILVIFINCKDVYEKFFKDILPSETDSKAYSMYTLVTEVGDD